MRKLAAQSMCKCNISYLMYYNYDMYSNSCISWFFLEIAPWLHVFRAEDAVDFSQLTFDPGQKELIAGARWEICSLFMLYQTGFFLCWELILSQTLTSACSTVTALPSKPTKLNIVCVYFSYAWPKLKDALPAIKHPKSSQYSNF